MYNLSSMTRYDAEHLLRMSEGRLCVRYFERPDGTILTQDCPVGWARVKQRVSVFAAAAVSLLISIFGSIFVVSSFSRRTQVVGSLAYPSPTPVQRTVPLIGEAEPLMGAVANTGRPAPTPKRAIRELKGDVIMRVGKPVAPTSEL
ncbi:MAG: hypothetical protein ABI481_12770 [Pyrinomonadaceae bacterium]